MKNYTFKEWSEARIISEGVDSDPQPGDFVITNPKAFMDAVLTKNGRLKNGGISNLSNFSRFRIDNVNGRKVRGSVSHRTYSGGFTKKFNSYDFLDVTPAFNRKDGSRVWINNAPGRRATAHYINKMYPIWAEKMGIEGQVAPELPEEPQEMKPQFQMDQEPQQEPEVQYKPVRQPQMPQLQMPQMQQAPYKQVQPQMPYKQIEPQSQDQQAAPWEKSKVTMVNREVVPTSDHGDSQGAGSTFGFDSPSDYDQSPDSIPMNGPDYGNDPFDMGHDDAPDMGQDMPLAASHDPMINAWRYSGEAKKYEYYPESDDYNKKVSGHLANVEKHPEQKNCSSCGKSMASKHNFCTSCGSRSQSNIDHNRAVRKLRKATR